MVVCLGPHKASVETSSDNKHKVASFVKHVVECLGPQDICVQWIRAPPVKLLEEGSTNKEDITNVQFSHYALSTVFPYDFFLSIGAGLIMLEPKKALVAAVQRGYRWEEIKRLGEAQQGTLVVSFYLIRGPRWGLRFFWGGG